MTLRTTLIKHWKQSLDDFMKSNVPIGLSSDVAVGVFLISSLLYLVKYFYFFSLIPRIYFQRTMERVYFLHDLLNKKGKMPCIGFFLNWSNILRKCDFVTKLQLALLPFLLKDTLMQIWKSQNIFVFILKYNVEDFTLKHLLLFEICVREICEKFVYKHSETIKYIKN